MASKYGWIPDSADHRDRLYTVVERAGSQPPSVDLRPRMPPVYNQGQLGSCVGNAVAAAFEYELKRRGGKPFEPSRLFIYYNGRMLAGTVAVDGGAQIRNGIKSVAKYGVAPDSLWPYSDSNPGMFSVKPTVAAYAEAMNHQALLYMRVPQKLETMKSCLASGFPFVFGFLVYESFSNIGSSRSMTITMPTPSEKVVGGHAVVCVGYDEAKKAFLIRNSWGESWGDRGHFWMPYRYATSARLVDDLWTIRSVET